MMPWWGWLVLVLALLWTQWVEWKFGELSKKVKRLEEASKNGWRLT